MILFDSSTEVALATALRLLQNRFGEPYTSAGQPAHAVILAFGKLGGEESVHTMSIHLPKPTPWWRSQVGKVSRSRALVAPLGRAQRRRKPRTKSLILAGPVVGPLGPAQRSRGGRRTGA